MGTTTISSPTVDITRKDRGRIHNLTRYFMRNPNLTIGLGMLLVLILFTLVGLILIDPDLGYAGAVRGSQAPSSKYMFGTDGMGRDLFTVAVLGTWVTLKIGFIAAFIGLGVGTVLGFVSAYFGGWVDNILRWFIDVFMTIPGFLILIVLAALLGGKVSTEGTALIIALFLWAGPARVIRSQVLSLKERQFVLMARLSGLGDMRIIFEELMPNLMPFMGALLVGSVMAAIYASAGLAILGLGNLREPQLGTTLYFMSNQGAVVRGMWWWVAVPVVSLCWVFVMLFMISSGLDEMANPRLRRRS